ncbi:unnamed protein product [Amoebophrya sp. A120]|nr:unnamed protein product [Amoebophrya sp. A120]|eukprot:GSA120T00004683001.1
MIVPLMKKHMQNGELVVLGEDTYISPVLRGKPANLKILDHGTLTIAVQLSKEEAEALRGTLSEVVDQEKSLKWERQMLKSAQAHDNRIPGGFVGTGPSVAAFLKYQQWKNAQNQLIEEKMKVLRVVEPAMMNANPNASSTIQSGGIVGPGDRLALSAQLFIQNSQQRKLGESGRSMFEAHYFDKEKFWTRTKKKLGRSEEILDEVAKLEMRDPTHMVIPLGIVGELANGLRVLLHPTSLAPISFLHDIHGEPPPGVSPEDATKRRALEKKAWERWGPQLAKALNSPSRSKASTQTENSWDKSVHDALHLHSISHSLTPKKEPTYGSFRVYSSWKAMQKNAALAAGLDASAIEKSPAAVRLLREIPEKDLALLRPNADTNWLNLKEACRDTKVTWEQFLGDNKRQYPGRTGDSLVWPEEDNRHTRLPDLAEEKVQDAMATWQMLDPAPMIIPTGILGQLANGLFVILDPNTLAPKKYLFPGGQKEGRLGFAPEPFGSSAFIQTQTSLMANLTQSTTTATDDVLRSLPGVPWRTTRAGSASDGADLDLGGGGGGGFGGSSVPRSAQHQDDGRRAPAWSFPKMPGERGHQTPSTDEGMTMTNRPADHAADGLSSSLQHAAPGYMEDRKTKMAHEDPQHHTTLLIAAPAPIAAGVATATRSASSSDAREGEEDPNDSGAQGFDFPLSDFVLHEALNISPSSQMFLSGFLLGVLFSVVAPYVWKFCSSSCTSCLRGAGSVLWNKVRMIRPAAKEKNLGLVTEEPKDDAQARGDANNSEEEAELKEPLLPKEDERETDPEVVAADRSESFGRKEQYEEEQVADSEGFGRYEQDEQEQEVDEAAHHVHVAHPREEAIEDLTSATVGSPSTPAPGLLVDVETLTNSPHCAATDSEAEWEEQLVLWCAKARNKEVDG